MNIIIRLETPDDYYSVEALTREAFWDNFWEEGRVICDEHFLVSKLRSCPTFIPELDYLAEIDGKPVGHIIYTRSRIEDDSGKVTETLTFGPLSVLPEYQNNGIGKALMRHTFEEARRLGHRAVLIFGHPDYYPRVGFRRAAEFGITTSDGKVYDPFMAYPLYEGALEGIHGRYFIDPVYFSLTQDESLEFDKRFQPKDMYTPLPIEILLDRLDKEARNAITTLECKNLTVIKSISEYELRSQTGITEKAIEIIRSTMHEHKLSWGE